MSETIQVNSDTLTEDQMHFFQECGYNLQETANFVMANRILAQENLEERNMSLSIFLNRLLQTAAEIVVSASGAAGRPEFIKMATAQMDAAILRLEEAKQ